jgi:hypothetical protein
MDVTLSVRDENLAVEGLHTLTQDLCRTIGRETDIDARLAGERSQPGMRGDAITIGTILLTVLSSGAAVALINVLKSFFERTKAIEVELQDKDGKKLRIKAENVHSDQEIERTIGLVRKLFES